MAITKILIPHVVWQQLSCYVDSKTEVSGFGTCRMSGRNLVVEKVFLLPQKASSKTVEIEAETLALFIDKFVREGGDPKELVLQWHSHGRLPVYWSKTDRVNIENLLAIAPWLVSLVLNKAGEYLCRIDIREPRIACNVDVSIIPTPPDAETERRFRNEVETKVTVLTEPDEGEIA